jgi:molybdopterin converting factor subunit 1
VIEILFFARLREALGLSRLTLELAEPVTVARLKALLAARGAPWQQALGQCQILAAVNQELADDTTTVRPGDEVALFPPATGG